jgi:magnesium-transporting ATPase (P-type)
VALSIGTKRMSDRKVIVRKLTAVESMGICTVIASDKTGVLTVNHRAIRIVVLMDVAFLAMVQAGPESGTGKESCPCYPGSSL